MDPRILWERSILLLAASLLVVALVHAGLTRVFRGRAPQALAVLAAVLAAAPIGLVLWQAVVRQLPQEERTGMWLYSGLVYSALASCYFHFFNMSETARRIRILTELYRRGPLSHDELMALYSVSDVLRVRFVRLVALGQLRLRDGCYMIDRKTMYYAARLTAGWRAVLGFTTQKPTGSAPYPEKRTE